MVLGDPVQLRQLFQNLIGNALKYHGADPPSVHVAAARQEREWLFSVRDNGVGIEPQHADRIFVIFQRLHTQAEQPGPASGWPSARRSSNGTTGASGWIPSRARVNLPVHSPGGLTRRQTFTED